MFYTDDSLYPENMQPLIISAAPYAPTWLPGDAEDIAVTWDEQVQAAVDCYNAGATVLHVHVRNPATGHLSADIDHFNYFIGLLKEAVPEMICRWAARSRSHPRAKARRPSGWTTTPVTCWPSWTRSRRPSQSLSAPP